VGTQSAFNPNNVRSGDTGTGLDLVEPLKFHHSMNTPFSARGTGISFEPATAFAHSSNEPVVALGTGITLDKPLDNAHEINVAVRTGTQEVSKADQWFGGPAITNAGTMVLRDAGGLVADSLNFGGVIDPWASEGYQARSPGNGCSAPSPIAAMGGRGRGGPATTSAPAVPTSRSAGRREDGVDTDSNCNDFAAGTASPGATNQR
jgi:non-reducing end alpha-L-arabinofuranosidase